MAADSTVTPALPALKHIQITLSTLLVAITGLWLLADPVLLASFNWLVLRSSLIAYTGMLSIGTMSMALVLAVRPMGLERWLGGLDRIYRLHKWLGISTLITISLHWMLTKAPKWLAELGLIPRPEHGAHALQTDPFFRALQSARGLAESVGEWAFYGAVVLIGIALVKRVPYRVFRKTHRLLAVLFLILGFHAVVLMPFAYWNQLIGSVMALLMIAGAIAALWILLDRVGLSRRVVGQVEYVASYASMNLLEVFVQLNNAWAGHKAGQFAFVTFNLNEGAHPFTISSAWEADGHMRFIIKELGDYTRTLALTIKPGDLVTIEGPYGQFEFTGRTQGQIWIAGGVGITPFIARMKALAIHNDGNPIDLFYCTAELDVSASDLLKHDASAARVNLHVILSARDGRLDGKRIRHTVPNWKANDIWFCGPAGLGKAVRRDLISSGMHPDAFHQELFEMR